MDKMLSSKGIEVGGTKGIGKFYFEYEIIMSLIASMGIKITAKTFEGKIEAGVVVEKGIYIGAGGESLTLSIAFAMYGGPFCSEFETTLGSQLGMELEAVPEGIKAGAKFGLVCTKISQQPNKEFLDALQSWMKKFVSQMEHGIFY